MNAKEKAIIQAIIDKSDAKRHQRAIDILTVGRIQDARGENVLPKLIPDYCKVIKSAVKCVCTGWRYNGLSDDDIYGAFLIHFIPAIEAVKEETWLKVEDLKHWLFRVAQNCAKKNIKEINIDLDVDTKNDGCVLSYDETWMKEEGQGESEDNIYAYSPDEPTELETFDNLINKYVDQLPIERDRVIVRAIKIDDMDREELAAELGLTPAALNLAYEEAWMRVLKRALPDIRYRARTMFKENEYKLKQNDAEILHDFFSGYNKAKEQIVIMAHDKNCTTNQMETQIVKAYKRLINLNKQEL